MKILFFGILIFLGGLAFGDQTIVDQWSSVTVPSPPGLQSVTLDPATTAILFLDFQNTIVQPRPRAVAVVPRVKTLLAWARDHKFTVVFSTSLAGNREAILPDVAPGAEEHLVKGPVDKFFRTDLEEFLASKGIETVVITGVAAEGAVLGTSIGAAIRGLKVVVPVDAIASTEAYAEQYVAWHLVNAPGVKGNVTLTTVGRLLDGPVQN